jgi:hypothetical protein
MNAYAPVVYNNHRTIRNSGTTIQSEGNSYTYAFITVLGLGAKVLGVLLFFGLLTLAGFAWIWLASFRSGWRFGSWLQKAENQNQEKVSLEILYGAIVAVLSPLAIFGNWSQTFISERFQLKFPPVIDFQEILEKQLGIKLPENSPCLPAPAAQANPSGDDVKSTPASNSNKPTT